MKLNPRKIICGSVVMLLQITTLCIAQLQQTTALELIGRCEKSQQLSMRHITRSETLVEYRSSEEVNKTRWTKYATEVRYDGERYDVIENKWRDLENKDAPTPLKSSFGYRQLWDGKTLIDGWYFKENKVEGLISNRLTMLHEKDSDNGNLPYTYGAPFIGIFTGDLKRATTILKEADKLNLRKDMEVVNGSSCFVIEVESENGKYTVWIDPKHGYNIAKAEAHKTGDHLAYGERMGTQVPPKMIASENRPRPRLLNHSFSMDNVQFEKVDGVWAPVEGEFKLTIEYEGWTSSEKRHHKRTHIDIDPDFEAVGAFKVDIPDGTRIEMPESPGVRYEWQGGRLVADIDDLLFEAIENIIAEEKSRVELEVASITDKEVEVFSKKSTPTVSPQPHIQSNTQASKQTPPEKVLQNTASKSTSFPTLTVVLIGLLCIGMVGWLLFRRIRSGGDHVEL